MEGSDGVCSEMVVDGRGGWRSGMCTRGEVGETRIPN